MIVSLKKQKKASKSRTAVRKNQLARVMSSTFAPAAVSIGQLTRSLSFGSFTSSGALGCRVSGDLPFITVGAETSTGKGLITRTGSRVLALDLSVVNSNYLCPQLARLASCFTRFRWTSLQFTYHPMASTASAVRLVFMYSGDALNPVTSAASNYTSYNSLLTTQYSVPFSPWVGWSLPVPAMPEWSYTTVYSSTVAANTRQGAPGVIACVADSDPGASYSYGVISLRFTLELLDPLPMISAPALAVAEQGDNQGSAIAPGSATDQPDGTVLVERFVPHHVAQSCTALPAVQRR